ncbi:MAG TPA: hypothetical protein VLE96_05160 [Chlamydiales bacterium]|nr:hypothetical protein [Chlamydiales bacterium]
MIKYWTVENANLYRLGNSFFSPQKVYSMDAEVRNAICSLTEIALKTQKGSQEATEEFKRISTLNERALKSQEGSQEETEELPARWELISAVAFSHEKGLCLRLNGVEHSIATAEEVYCGKVQGLQEIKQIQAALERQRIIPFQKTDENARAIFHKVMTQRAAKIEAPTMLNRTGVLKGDETSCVEKICKVAVVWKVIVFFTGLSTMKMAFDKMVSALTGGNHWEKYFLSCANFLEGLNTLATATVVLMKDISKIAHNFLTYAAAGAAFPITALMLYGSILVAAIYRLYVQLKFKYQLHSIVGDCQEPEKLKEAIIWLKQQTQLSSLELNEGKPNTTLRNKWDNFTLRVEEGVIDGLLDPKELDTLIEQFDQSKASGLITEVQRGNLRAILWSVGSMIINIIGICAVIAYLGAFGHITALALAVLFVIAAVGGLFTDSPALRVKFFRWLLENSDCVKSENQSIADSNCSETTSCLSYGVNEVLPRTPSKPTAATSHHFPASCPDTN